MSPVTVVRVTPVAALVTVTAAPTMTAPVESSTVPVMLELAVTACPKAEAARASSSRQSTPVRSDAFIYPLLKVGAHQTPVRCCFGLSAATIEAGAGSRARGQTSPRRGDNPELGWEEQPFLCDE